MKFIYYSMFYIIILFLVIIFHFIDADYENSKSYEKEMETKVESIFLS